MRHLLTCNPKASNMNLVTTCLIKDLGIHSLVDICWFQKNAIKFVCYTKFGIVKVTHRYGTLYFDLHFDFRIPGTHYRKIQYIMIMYTMRT